MRAAAPDAAAPELVIDTAVARRIIGDFIREQLRQAGFERAVLALSGGIDSALVAFLVAEAIGAERLLCVLMPYRTSAGTSRSHAEDVVRRIGAASTLVDITPMVDGYFENLGDAAAPGGDTGRTVAAGGGEAGTVAVGESGGVPGAPESTVAGGRAPAAAVRRGNFMARMRMAVVYDHSVTWGGLVVGTGNKTESLIGYTTVFGDSACAFNPIGDLYKTQVRQLAAALGVPPEIVAKAPSADLWPGQTDEAEVGFSYAEVDRLLFWMIDRRRSHDELGELGFDPMLVDRVERLVATSEFKRQVPPIAKLGRRTTGIDYLYPRRRPGSARR